MSENSRDNSRLDDPTEPLNLKEMMGRAINRTLGKIHVRVNDLDESVKARIDEVIPHALELLKLNSPVPTMGTVCYIQAQGSKIVSSARNAFTRNLFQAVGMDTAHESNLNFRDVRQVSYFFQELRAAAQDDTRFKVSSETTLMGDKKIIIRPGAPNKSEASPLRDWHFGG